MKSIQRRSLLAISSLASLAGLALGDVDVVSGLRGCVRS